MSKISLRDVHKRFGAKVVLEGIDLDVQEGESLVVIGGSGTGKSVLIKCILGLVKPERGSIRVGGMEMTTLTHTERQEALKQFGMLFQGGALFDSLRVWENIAFAVLQNRALSKEQARALAVEKLAMVGLPAEVAMLSPAELSGGMQKRVALARAIAHQPNIIFFDEPTTGLDPIMADVINDLIIRCTRELGLTTITITHDMASVRKIASRVAMLYQGKLIWQGAADAIDRSENPYVDQFVHGRAHGPITTAARAA